VKPVTPKWVPPKWNAEYEQEHHNLAKYEITENKKYFLTQLKTKGKTVSFTPDQIITLSFERYDYYLLEGSDLNIMSAGQRWLMCKKDRDEWAVKFDKATFLPMPILLTNDTNYVCYGGRHRIGWCEYRKIPLKAWVVSMEHVL